MLPIVLYVCEIYWLLIEDIEEQSVEEITWNKGYDMWNLKWPRGSDSDYCPWQWSLKFKLP